jgi:hypothetical protein
MESKRDRIGTDLISELRGVGGSKGIQTGLWRVYIRWSAACEHGFQSLKIESSTMVYGTVRADRKSPARR